MKKQEKIRQITPMYRITYLGGGVIQAQASFTHEWMMEETYNATKQYYDKKSIVVESRKDFDKPWKKIKLS